MIYITGDKHGILVKFMHFVVKIKPQEMIL